MASAKPVYYYSVYPETLQNNGVCTTPGKALGFELIALHGRGELITSHQAPVTLKYSAQPQELALASMALTARSEPGNKQGNMQV